MTQKPVKTAGKEMLRALGDLVILSLLLVGAGFGGYMWGIHQKLAPIQAVAPGTPGAQAPGAQTIPPPAAEAAKQSADKNSASQDKTDDSPVPTATKSSAKQNKRKFWIASSGSDYIGYSITVRVNDTAVDNFFGPGKIVDITRLVKHGDNTVVFAAKALGNDYNNHQGDASSVLNVQIVSGPHVQDNFKSSDVLASYKRSAADSDDANETKHFDGE